MKSICFFSSYYDTSEIPYYVRCYLSELVNHFERIILVTNEKQLIIQDRLFLEEKKIEVMSAELTRIPMNTMELNEEQSNDVLKLVDHLEQDDDVQKVYHNLK